MRGVKPCYLIERCMNKLFLAAFVLVGLGVGVHAQTLLYQWTFNNSNDTISNSAATYAWVPGTGNLTIQNISGDVSGLTGTDGINPLVYFNNSIAGLGVGTGAFVANGQGYNSGNNAVAIANNLNLGDMGQFTLTYWAQMDPSTAGTIARFVQIGAKTNYDVNGKGSGNFNGVGTSLNQSPFGYASFQNGIAGSTSGLSVTMCVTNALPNGLPQDGATWYFVAITYDGTLTQTNFINWVGATNQSVQIVNGNGNSGIQNANFGAIHFTTNATILIGNDNDHSASRALSSGAIADVRLYSGVLTSNQLNLVRAFQIIDTCYPQIVTQPVSQTNYAGSDCTFTCNATIIGPCGCPVWGCNSYQWKENGVPITGSDPAAPPPSPFDKTLILKNIPLSANGATFVCTVTGEDGVSIDSIPVTLTVIQPSLTGVPDPNIQGNLRLVYPALYSVLQESTNVSGPYTDVSGATSPLSIPMTNSQHFFRLR
jgi:hypothetical protein